MFESAEVGHKIGKAAWARRLPPLRTALLDAQGEVLSRGRFPVILVVGGVDGAGKGETVSLMNQWLDPRYVLIHPLGGPEDAEEQSKNMPSMWRFWRTLPPKGKIGVLLGSWYTKPIVGRVYKETRKADLEEQIQQILRFERLLVDDGACIVKLWFHLSKKAQKARLKTLESDKETSWRVSATDWRHFHLYDDFREVSSHVLEKTSVSGAPWTVIEGVDARYRSMTAGQTLLSAMERRLKEVSRTRAPKLAEALPGKRSKDVLGALDVDLAVSKEKYEAELLKWERRLNLVSRDSKLARRSVVVAFEGPDAAGKGGAIRRVTAALDARRYEIVPVAAPTEAERAFPYLWRFWRHVPRPGRFTIFDRSWYGRVLVERVERLCPLEAWTRAYSEIRDFEDQLAENGVIVVKVWLAISKEEQLTRFRAREEADWKRFKITPEDWRNRRKWAAYEEAANDMVARTSTPKAPWTLVAANDKEHARITVLETVTRRIEEAL